MSPQKAIRVHVDEEDKKVNDSFTVNGTPLFFINESGLYALILSSYLELAQKCFCRQPSSALGVGSRGARSRREGNGLAPLSLSSKKFFCIFAFLHFCIW